MQLKVVLLPDPFGPIRPRISPSFTSKETSFTARRAPNLLVRPDTLSIGMGGAPVRQHAVSCPAQAGHPVNTAPSVFTGSVAFAGGVTRSPLLTPLRLAPLRPGQP